MCHARVSGPRRAGSSIKVLNHNSTDDALDPSTSLPPVRGRDDTPGVKGKDVMGNVCKTEIKTYLGGSLIPGSGGSPVNEENGGN